MLALLHETIICLWRAIFALGCHCSEKEPLGSGQFGYVMRGSWMSDKGAEPMDVAIKVLKRQSSIMEKIKFLQEAAIMGQFYHSNIVHLYGVVTEGESVS